MPELPPDRGRVARYPNASHLMLRDWGAPKIRDDIASRIAHPEAPPPSGANLKP